MCSPQSAIKAVDWHAEHCDVVKVARMLQRRIATHAAQHCECMTPKGLTALAIIHTHLNDNEDSGFV